MRGYQDQPAPEGGGLRRGARPDPTVLRIALVAGAGVYLLLALGGQRFPAPLFWTAAALCTIALGVAWQQSGWRTWRSSSTAALGIPLHLAIIGLGGLTSPITPILALWLLILSRSATTRGILLVGAAAYGWVIGVESLWGRLDPYVAVETLLIFAAGILPSLILQRTTTRPGTASGEPGEIAAFSHPAAADLERDASPRRVDLLGPALERVRALLGAERAVLWEVDAASEEARPHLVSGGRWPPAMPLVGDPLGLALEDGAVIRLEPAPRWAPEAARSAVVPMERPGEYTAVLTVDYPEESPFPELAILEEAADRLHAYLDLQREVVLARIAQERFSGVIDLLNRIPLQVELPALAAGLAEAVRDFLGMSGAAVARWDRETGHFLSVIGDDGGVAAGTSFQHGESELALAAANGTIIKREGKRGERSRLPLLAKGERWFAEPRTTLLIPLDNPAVGIVGVLALWSADPITIEEEEVEILKVVVPYAAMQLHQLHLYSPLVEQAERDHLTGLFNRRLLEDRIAAEDARFHRYGRPTALLILDIDHFKAINDTHGHEAGDAALQALARVIRSTVRETDLAARLGGEEFVVLLPETALAGALEIAERLRKRVEELELEWEGRPIELRVSVGAAAAPECVIGPAELLAAADAALYESKRGGRNRVTAAPYGKSYGSNG